MSAELAAILATVLTVGIGLAGLIVALWRDMRAELRAVEAALRAEDAGIRADIRVMDTDLRADIRAVHSAIDADRVSHEALHAAERRTREEEARELRATIAASREGAP